MKKTIIFLLALNVILNSSKMGIAQTEFKIRPDVPKADDQFGTTVSISGDYLIVGAFLSGDRSGAAYIFKRNDSSWIQQEKLFASNPMPGDDFGISVAIDGDFAVVGSSEFPLGGTGAVYFFIRSGTNWSLIDKLTANDASTGDGFGFSVDIDGDLIVAGATGVDDSGENSGAIYIFQKLGSNILQEEKLVPSSGGNFGDAVSISENFVVVGDQRDDLAGDFTGSAYVFKKIGFGNWVLQDKITASDAAAGDLFGGSVSISGDYAFVGATGNSDDGSQSGSVYVFKRNGSNWPQHQKLTADDAQSSDLFGSSVSIDGDYAVIGARYDRVGGIHTGSAYIFTRSGSLWAEEGKLAPSDGERGHYFGTSVSISEEKVLVGADVISSAYVYSLPTLDVRPTILSFDSALNSRPFNITNTGIATLKWLASTDKPWVMLSQTGGNIPKNETEVVTVTVDRSNLEPGSYSGKVILSSNGGDEEVIVNMTVPNPILSVTPTNLDFGSSTPSLTFSITNIGTGTLTWTVDDDQQWITVSPDSGSTTTETDQSTVAVNRSGLRRGDYSGTVTVTSNGGTATVPVDMTVEGVENVSATSNFRHGKDQRAYQIISVPAILDDTSPDAVLSSLGQYNKKKWRLFDSQDGININIEYPDTRNFEPGVGLFLLVKESDKKIETGGGSFITEITDLDYSIPLIIGWNLIGNPYNLSIPVVNLSLTTGNNVNLWTFEEGEWQNTVTTFQHWKGYAIVVDQVDTLQITPTSTSSTGIEPSSHDFEVSERNWRIQITAQCKTAKDNINFAGVRDNSVQRWDRYDIFEPPPFGDYIMVSFPHPEWGKFLSHYAADYKSPEQAGYIWDFEVQTSYTTAEVKLDFSLDEMPRDKQVWLVDSILNVVKDLRWDSSYHFVSGRESSKKSLRLLVGDQGFVETNSPEMQSIPESYELSQNFPNPFNPATTIRYGLPRAEKVVLKVYNLLGEEVATLVSGEEKSPGNHISIWDGRNDAGRSVASGVYIIHIRAGPYVQTRKMLMIK